MKTKRINLTAIAFGIFFCLIGCVGAIGSWGAYRLDTGIANSGSRAVGHITRKSMLESSDGDSDYIVDYWFKLPNGQRVEAHRGVHKELWHALREGEPFTVMYSSHRPNRNFPLGGGVTSVGVTAFVSSLAAAFAVFGALLIVGAVRHQKIEA